jgi:hypothetical protein
MREGGPYWRAKPKIESRGLDIGSTCQIALDNGVRVSWVAREGLIERLGDLEPDMREGGPYWRAKPKIEPRGLDIGWTCGFPPQEGNGALRVAEGRRFDQLGGLEPGIREGGWI